jgi:hypothetical protein
MFYDLIQSMIKGFIYIFLLITCLWILLGPFILAMYTTNYWWFLGYLFSPGLYFFILKIEEHLTPRWL